MEFDRLDRDYAPVNERTQHYKEFLIPLENKELKEQSARCMDCGIPYCHNGCPVNNLIPDWNDLVYEGNWKNGIWNGRGKYIFNDGFGYEGEWKNGVENGMGILTYLNGDKYEGEFKNGKMLNGKMYKKNGDIHVQKNNEWKIE